MLGLSDSIPSVGHSRTELQVLAYLFTSFISYRRHALPELRLMPPGTT